MLSDEADGGHGYYPVSIDIPDMHCKTEWYLQLKQAYAARANIHLAAIKNRVHTLLTLYDLPVDAVTDYEIHFFVKHIRSLKVVRTTPLRAEYDAATFNSATVNESIEEWKDTFADADDSSSSSSNEESVDEEQSAVAKAPRIHNFQWYVSLRAMEQFVSNHKRQPGRADGGGELTVSEEEKQLESDTHILHSLATSLISELKVDDEASLECCFEVARCFGAELHNVAAFLGGVASQEALKLLVRQYVPLNSTFVHNAIDCTSLTLPL